VKTFLISDTHFGHFNIIKHCNRPFYSINNMDKSIINNWNKVVSNEDVVYFLGDFCEIHHNPKYWLRYLNGNISFIEGNHDHPLKKYHVRPLNKHFVISYKEEKFLLCHYSNPSHPYSESIEFTWDGWVIHGHEHNHTPLINKRKKRLNVSCENLNYTPIEIGALLQMRNK